MSKKYQVFVSSTYHDLEEEREQVIKAVLEMGHIPVGMEMFSAADEEQWKIIARQIDDIDYYTVIVAHRYGSVTNEGISFTEKEFDYAVSKGIPTLGFIIDDGAPWPKDRHEVDSRGQKRLAEFKRKVKSRLIQFWTNKDDLHGKFSISLMKAITANPRTGWVRATETSGAEVTRELTRLSSENAELRKELQSLRKLEQQKEDDVIKVVKILSDNQRTFRVRMSEKWEDAKSFTRTFGDIFQYCAPGLISENSSLGVGHELALRVVGVNYHKNWPIGANVISEMIADLAALDLVEPSKKKHSVNDQSDYWSLTKLGKEVLRRFRRVRLEERLEPSPESKSDE